MKATVEHLFRVQKLLRPGFAAVEEQQAVVRKLQAKVPAPILAHYLRMVENGRNGVAIVRNGVCGECHIRVPSGTLAGLASPKDLHVCESCGCYLLLPDGETAGGRAMPGPAPRARQAAVAV